jgi:hypothetical protein
MLRRDRSIFLPIGETKFFGPNHASIERDACGHAWDIPPSPQPLQLGFQRRQFLAGQGARLVRRVGSMGTEWKEHRHQQHVPTETSSEGT